MFDLREEQERVILVGVQENGGANAEESLDELAELAKQLDTIGETNAYDRIQHAVELFRHGNEHLAEVLKDLQ